MRGLWQCLIGWFCSHDFVRALFLFHFRNRFSYIFVVIRTIDADNLSHNCFLLDRGVDINVQNSFGRTALFKAAGYGQAATVKLLISRGAELFLKVRAILFDLK